MYSWLYILKINIEAIASNKNDTTFTMFLFFWDERVDCNLKEINRVMPANDMKPRPKMRTFCGSTDLNLLNFILKLLFPQQIGHCQ